MLRATHTPTGGGRARSSDGTRRRPAYVAREIPRQRARRAGGGVGVFRAGSGERVRLGAEGRSLCGVASGGAGGGAGGCRCRCHHGDGGVATGGHLLRGATRCAAVALLAGTQTVQSPALVTVRRRAHSAGRFGQYGRCVGVVERARAGADGHERALCLHRHRMGSQRPFRHHLGERHRVAHRARVSDVDVLRAQGGRRGGGGESVRAGVAAAATALVTERGRGAAGASGAETVPGAIRGGGCGVAGAAAQRRAGGAARGVGGVAGVGGAGAGARGRQSDAGADAGHGDATVGGGTRQRHAAGGHRAVPVAAHPILRRRDADGAAGRRLCARVRTAAGAGGFGGPAAGARAWRQRHGVVAGRQHPGAVVARGGSVAGAGAAAGDAVAPRAAPEGALLRSGSNRSGRGALEVVLIGRVERRLSLWRDRESGGKRRDAREAAASVDWPSVTGALGESGASRALPHRLCHDGHQRRSGGVCAGRAAVCAGGEQSAGDTGGQARQAARGGEQDLLAAGHGPGAGYAGDRRLRGRRVCQCGRGASGAATHRRLQAGQVARAAGAAAGRGGAAARAGRATPVGATVRTGRRVERRGGAVGVGASELVVASGRPARPRPVRVVRRRRHGGVLVRPGAAAGAGVRAQQLDRVG
eukprot:ctg_2795.g555